MHLDTYTRLILTQLAIQTRGLESPGRRENV